MIVYVSHVRKVKEASRPTWVALNLLNQAVVLNSDAFGFLFLRHELFKFTLFSQLLSLLFLGECVQIELLDSFVHLEPLKKCSHVKLELSWVHFILVFV